MTIPALLAAATIALWATAIIPEYLTALLFFTLAMALHAAPADVVFAGFASSAFWLVLSGFVLGGAILKVGLADRVAKALAPHLSASWPRMVGGVVALGYGLAFVMPSNMGRIALLMPIVMALAERAGFKQGDNGRIGLALGVGCGAFMLPASILPANVPNLVLAGVAERVFGIHFAYLPYLLLHGPVLGVAKGALLVAILLAMFPATPQRVAAQAEPPRPLSAAERRLVLLLAATLGLWVTDTLHGVSPAWVGLAAACICLLPRVGFLTGEEFAAVVNARTCIYVAGILGLAAMVSQSGLGDAIGHALISVLPLDPARPALNFGSLAALAAGLNFVVTANGLPAIFTPLGQSLADATGFPLATALMVQVVGYSTPFLPYQASPLVVAMQMGSVPQRAGLRFSLALATATFLLIVPLDFVWFRVLGWIL